MKNFKLLSFIMGVILSLSMVFVNVNTAYAEGKSIDNVFVSESAYENTMNNVVVPYINRAKGTGYMDVGQPNFKIYYEKYKVPNSKGNIVISHGFTESLEKYREMIYYFMNEGFSVYGLEHRGHGRSGHLGVKDASQVNVDKFDDYLLDLKSFLDKIVLPETQGQKLFLFAHSMGGGIGGKFLEDYPGYFDAAVLSAPMMEVNTGKVPPSIAALISNANVALSFGNNYVMGQNAYDHVYNFAESCTTSEARYAYTYNIVESNPEIQRGGASYNWLQTSLDATKKMVLQENASKVIVPVLLFQAGNDSYVKPNGQNKFASYAANCTLVQVANSKHEIYRENDGILKPYLNQVMSFYNSNI